ncbi:MAG: glycoside hydrolase family 13 protein [Lachnospiraceae bacterium]|nr:glycoside hydrolase family 13 protein [Lachnospiraceae bacterium]
MENGSKIYEIYRESMPFNKAAVFSDGTASYRIPPEPMPYESVKIRIRTAHQKISEVLLCAGEKRLSMTVGKTTERFDFYETDLYLTNEAAPYYFMIRFGDEEYYYTRAGVDTVHHAEYDFEIVPGYTIPDWAKGAVFYQIFVDRFCNGDSANDVLDREYNYIGEPTMGIVDWNRYPSSMDVRAFYGGDLAGVMRKLDYLQELGVEVIYLNPIFVSPSNHKYDIQDYDYIDPHYGVILKDEGECLPEGEKSNKMATKYISRVTSKENLEASNAYFISLVEEIHRRGMKVILDGVFNHCGSFNKWLDREGIYEEAEGYEKGAYVSEDSPYHTFFQFHKPESEEWPYNASYDGWWGHDTLPKLNYEASPKLFNYIMRIARKWVSPPYNVDGWRLDVAADLGHSPEYNHYFWRAFRDNVRRANPQALILAEHYGDPQPWLQGNEWDSVMNYDAFMEPVTWFLTGLEKHSDEYRHDMYCNSDAFFGAMRHYMTRFHTQSLMVAMNELSNHDHSRFMTRTNHRVGRTATSGPQAAGEGLNPAIMREAVVIQMTWIGAPTIYYGDEAGVCGWTDPDNRRTYPWGHEDKGLIALHRELIAIHKAYQSLRTGSLKFVYGAHGVIGYGRFNEEEQFVILVNNNDYEVNVQVSVWQLGVVPGRALVRMLYTNTQGFGVDMALYYPEDGILSMRLWPFSSVVLKNFPEHLC